MSPPGPFFSEKRRPFLRNDVFLSKTTRIFATALLSASLKCLSMTMTCGVQFNQVDTALYFAFFTKTAYKMGPSRPATLYKAKGFTSLVNRMAKVLQAL